MNEIDKNGSFRSFWRSITTIKIDLDRDGISLDQNDQKPTSNDRDRSPTFLKRDKGVVVEHYSVFTPEIQEEHSREHYSDFYSERCNGCPYWSNDCTASFYERTQSKCESTTVEIQKWLTKLDNSGYMDKEAMAMLDKLIFESPTPSV